MKYKNIRYYRTWIQGNWFLILPAFQKSIQLVNNCSIEDIEKIIDNEVYQFI